MKKSRWNNIHVTGMYPEFRGVLQTFFFSFFVWSQGEDLLRKVKEDDFP